MRRIDRGSRRKSQGLLHLGFIYRAISLLLTSFVFFIGTTSPIIFKIGVVSGLIVAGWIVVDLQMKYIQQPKILKLLVVVETVGLTCLLLPTGGIVSPFIWYALNPVLLAASFLTPFFSWTILTVYLGSATWIASRNAQIGEIISGMSIVYLVSILTILLAILFSKLTKELTEQTVLLGKQQDNLVAMNADLTKANAVLRSMEHMKNQLIISEEQNRIANEIHDSVAQRLFGIVYALHGLKVRRHSITDEELDEEYTFLSDSAQTTIKELRSAIYRLSSLKKGETPFFDRLKTYLDDYARLNSIRIAYDLTGNEALIVSEMKEALYRVICEASGNAVRHGKASVIEVTLTIMETVTVVEIYDNGSGFIARDGTGKEQGIGLLNMRNSVASFGGDFSIKGEKGAGTTVYIEMPSVKILKGQEVAGV